MDVTYYPGCSLESTARDYDKSIRAVCSALGIVLHELKNWTCCGATSAHSLNERAALLLPGVNLPAAQAEGRDMLVPCPLCFNRMKRSQKELGATIGIHDLASFLAREEWLSAIKSAVKTPLSDFSAVCYYGCMANRPPKVIGSANYENPCEIDAIAEALGVNVRPWSYKTDCCGASFALSRQDILFTLVRGLYEHALDAGAGCIIVSCQMCHANLDMYQKQISRQFGKNYGIPIFYFTELIGLALGLAGSGSWLSAHITDADGYLKNKACMAGVTAGQRT
jgi:heterodisulfide reductase subunit B